MKWFFEDEQKQKELYEEIESWLGTPYRHQVGIKGMGTDCIYFVATALHAVGAFKDRAPIIPEYPRDWHLHRGEERLLKGLVHQLDAEYVDVDYPMNGDVILFQYGRQAAHCSIYYNGGVYQCLTDMGVFRCSWKDKNFFKRRKFNLRVKA